MDVDLYLACRTGASNIPNILYENLGDGTFRRCRRCWRRSRPRRNCSCERRGHCRYRGQRPITTSMVSWTCSSPTGSTCGRSISAARTRCSATRATASAGSRSTSSVRGRIATQSARAFTRRRAASPDAHTERRLPPLVAGHATQPLRSCGRRGDVDLRVEWPSGAVQTLTRVAANRLYRITEGAGIVAVTPGVAPAYPVRTATTERRGRQGHFRLAGLPDAVNGG